MRLPDVPTTPAQRKVIAWTSVIVMAAIGGVAFYYLTDAGPADAEMLRKIGFASFGLAGVVLLIKWLVTSFVD